VIKRLLVVGLCGAISAVADAHAQALVPEAAAVAESPQNSAAAAQVEHDVRRFGVGVQGGVGLDPEIIDFGAHATFSGVFKPNLAFRPGLEIGAGEVTTFLGVNLDFVYELAGNRTNEGWLPYVGAGPTFGLSHRGFGVDAGDLDHVDQLDPVDGTNRFNFSDTDFNGGMNFIVGMRKSRMFFEMKATAWGVANIRLVAGYNF